MNEKYTIIRASVTHDDNILIVFECESNEVGTLTRSIEVPPDTSVEDTLDRIDTAAYNAIQDFIEVSNREKERANKEKEKENARKSLKSLIDKEIGKYKPIKKPDKKEKKNDRKK